MGAKEDIQYAIVKLMDENNVRGTDLAKHLNVTKAAVSNWRSGRTSIDVDLIPSICDYFHISVNDFFSMKRQAPTEVHLTLREAELLDAFRNMDEAKRNAFLNLAKAISGIE